MTRINLLPPSELTGKHLVAEYKEITRVFTHVKKHVDKGRSISQADIPDSYRMGTGHVKFFYDKLKFIRKRYISIMEEMWRRGYKTNRTLSKSILRDAMANIPSEWWNDYIPTRRAIRISRERVKSRESPRR